MMEPVNLSTDGMCTVAYAAEFLSLSKSMIYLLMERGELTYAKFGKSRRIPRKALISLANQNTVGGSQ